MSKDIQALRAEIDAIDEELIALLNTRSMRVLEVGAIKKTTQSPGMSFIRPGREAEMVRRMREVFKGAVFPAAAAAHVWRMIISASLSLESALSVAAYAPESRQDIYWLAREYFGPFTAIARESTARRVLSEVMEGKTGVGVLPLPDDSAEGKWWLKLQPPLNIFACIPFILSKGEAVRALAVAKVEPEETGDDLSFFSIETQGDISQSRIKAALDHHKLEGRWLASESFASGHRVHLIEIRGFVTAGHDFANEVKAAIGASLIAIKCLGAYALPVLV